MTSTRKENRGPSAGPENRRALIDAARTLFAEEGLAAPLSAIARRAGVGQGSLYRHFPDRVALAVAVFDDNIGEIERSAAHPEATLGTLFDAVTEQAMESAALIDLITRELHEPRTEHLRTRVSAVIAALLARDQRAGRVRPDVQTDDVLLAVGMIAVFLGRTDADDRQSIAARARAMFRTSFEVPRAGPAT